MYYILGEDNTPKEVTVSEWDIWWLETKALYPERWHLFKDTVGNLSVITIFHRSACPEFGFFETRVKNTKNPDAESYYEHFTYNEAKSFHQNKIIELNLLAPETLLP